MLYFQSGVPGSRWRASVLGPRTTKNLWSAGHLDGGRRRCGSIVLCAVALEGPGRPERGDNLQGVPPPFHGLTLVERDDEPPPAFYEGQRRTLYSTCGTLVRWDAHKSGTLHLEWTVRARNEGAAQAT